MRPDPAFIAACYLNRPRLASIQGNLTALETWRKDLESQVQLMDRLIAAGEARRLGRTGAIKVKSVQWDEKVIQALIQGTTGDYKTRITVSPRPGHHCTCPDWQRNGQRVGPCKHVLRLGEYWKEERVLPALERFEESLMSLLTRLEV
jgi:uncharacterized Zn finger protein